MKQDTMTAILAYTLSMFSWLAALRDVPLASIEQATTDNFFRLFRHVQRPV